MRTEENKPFIKFMRHSRRFKDLIEKRPTAFCLLTLIAERARRTDEDRLDDLNQGDALIGDYRSYGVSRQVYRSDITFLKKWQFVTTKPTTKGTIAFLCDNSIFDINITANQPSKQHVKNQQSTTNKNDKNVKEVYTRDNTKDSLSPLSRQEVIKLAIANRVDLTTVRRVEQDALDPDKIKKYGIKSIYRTVGSWLRRGIGRGEIRELDDLGYMALKDYYSPKL